MCSCVVFSPVKPSDRLDQMDDHTNYLFHFCMDFPQHVSKLGEFSIVFIYASPVPALMEYQPSHQNCENTQLISTTDAQHKIWLRGTESKWCHRSRYKLLVDHLSISLLRISSDLTWKMVYKYRMYFSFHFLGSNLPYKIEVRYRSALQLPHLLQAHPNNQKYFYINHISKPLRTSSHQSEKNLLPFTKVHAK